MYQRGKKTNVIGEALEGYSPLQKKDVTEPIKIENVVKGISREGNPFIYVCGTHTGKKVYVSVPAISLSDFSEINDQDIAEIKKEGLSMVIESHVSKDKGRTYYTAYIN